MFMDRNDAGRQLAKRLAPYRKQHPTILALPRGGVPVAAEVAAALDAPLDLVLVRKIGVPRCPEWAMGAIVDGGAPIVVRNEDVMQMANIDEAEFKQICSKELVEIERRRQLYLGSRMRAELSGRLVIVVDDGIATGATTRAALHAIRKRDPKKLVLAVPVGPTDTLAEMCAEADEVICLEKHKFFGAIGLYYRDFRQITDHEVVELLAQLPARKPDETGLPAA